MGIELLLQKTKGKITGWIGYTLSKTTHQFDNINNGIAYPYKYDRRHDIGISLSYNMGKNRSCSVSWVFGTGHALSLPVSKYYLISDSNIPQNEIDSDFDLNEEIHIYGAKNSFRMRNYHRLDIGYNASKMKKNGMRTWSFGIYNLYNRQNPYYYYLAYEYDANKVKSRPKIMQKSLFPLIPSISYSFVF